ncbi:MAG TPA: hypothetical protein VGR61_09940 [Candidatus Dormibacteraeota bacterium]|nr:hypothetical protein [Candidatus Dormibacteraeota bacterium]
MEEQSPESRLESWRTWIFTNLAPLSDRVDLGAAAAVAAGQQGLGRFGAAAAACVSMGLACTPEVFAGMQRELGGLDELIGTLPRLQPGNGLTQEGLEELGRQIGARRGEYARLMAQTAPRQPAPANSASLPAPSLPAVPGQVGSPSGRVAAPGLTVRNVLLGPPAPPSPAFSLQGFLSEHGILVISYVGAFLLIVATLLFEVYGTTGADGVVRFGAVMVLTVFFAAAGWYGLRSDRLRLVGRSYVAVAALMTPLDFAAAYSFLVLNRFGISVAVAVTLAGASCALLYGVLARGLRSVAYAHMSLLAVAVGWAGFLTAVSADRASGPAFALLAFPYVLLAERPGPLSRVTSLWKPFSAWYVHAAAAAGLTWTLVSSTGLDLVPGMRYLAIGFAVVAGAYLLQALLNGSRLAAALAGSAVLGAWATGIVGAGITDWAGAALAPAALVVVAVRRGSLGRRLSNSFGPSSGAALYVAAGSAALWTTALARHAGTRDGSLFAAATFAVLAVAFLVDAARSKDQVGAGVGLASGAVAYLALLYRPDLGAWRGAAFLPAVAAFAILANRQRLMGAIGPVLAPAAGLLSHVGALAAILLAAQSAAGWPMTTVLAALTVLYAGEAIAPRRRGLVLVAALGVSATVLQASRPLALGNAAIALELVLLGWGYLLTSRLALNRDVRLTLLAVGAAQALATALLPVSPDSLDALLLLAAAAVGLAIAVTDRKPIWLSAATPLFTLAWYHAAAAVIPAPPTPGPDDLVRVFAPLPVVYSVVGLGLRRRFGRAWTLPPHVSAALIATAVIYGGLVAGDYFVVGWALLAYSVLAYLTAILERSAVVVAAAALMLAGAVPSLLRSGAAPEWSYSLALVGACGLLYVLHLAWRDTGPGDDWLLVHRAGGLGGAAVTVLGASAASAALSAGDPQFISGAVATLCLAGLLFADAELHSQPLLEYAAGLTAVLALYWVDRAAGAANPQLYLAPIGLAVTAASVIATHDRRLRLDRGLLQTSTACGLALLLGTTAVQSVSEAVPWMYTGVLVAEAGAAVVVGVGIRNRTLVIGGGAAVALASLRALVLIEQTYPLYIVFGGVALVLLVVAGALSMMRDRFTSARGSLGRTWHEWD